MFKVTYELILKSFHQLFFLNQEIHSYDSRNKDLLIVSTGTKNTLLFLVAGYGMP